MANDPRRKVVKIHNQIKRITQKGKDNIMEYHKLIDEIVDKGDYANLEICLSDFYNIDTSKYKNTYELKSKTWKVIMFETDSNFITNLKKIYNMNSVYQQGHEIRSENLDYTILNVSGDEFGHYPFREETIILSDTWNNGSEKQIYTQVATSSQITISKDIDSIKIELIDDLIYQIDVSKVIWATYSIGQNIIESPYELNRLNVIQTVGTQSYLSKNDLYNSKIPTTHGGDYLITVKRRGTPGWLSHELTFESYSYKVYVRKEDLLGTIKEVESYDQSNYLHLNRKFAELTGMKKTYLEVTKNGLTEPITVIYDNESFSEERNLLERYKIAIGYLNS